VAVLCHDDTPPRSDKPDIKRLNDKLGVGVEHPASLPPVPEPGQVVNVCGFTWAVADVRQQDLPRSPADEGAAGSLTW
jgi:hypothetical protein